MRKSLLEFPGIVFAIIAVSLVAPTTVPAATKGLIIAQDGAPMATIYRFSLTQDSTDSAEVVGFGADRLKEYYQKMSGAKLRNVSNVNNLENPISRRTISITSTNRHGNSLPNHQDDSF